MNLLRCAGPSVRSLPIAVTGMWSHLQDKTLTGCKGPSGHHPRLDPPATPREDSYGKHCQGSVSGLLVNNRSLLHRLETLLMFLCLNFFNAASLGSTETQKETGLSQCVLSSSVCPFSTLCQPAGHWLLRDGRTTRCRVSDVCVLVSAVPVLCLSEQRDPPLGLWQQAPWGPSSSAGSGSLLRSEGIQAGNVRGRSY